MHAYETLFFETKNSRLKVRNKQKKRIETSLSSRHFKACTGEHIKHIFNVQNKSTDSHFVIPVSRGAHCYIYIFPVRQSNFVVGRPCVEVISNITFYGMFVRYVQLCKLIITIPPSSYLYKFTKMFAHIVCVCFFP